MNKRSSLALLLSLSLFVSAYGQTPKQTSEQDAAQDEVVRITTNLVQIDAVVTDKKGQPVTDLRAEDFEITEDGRPQKITNLSYVSTATRPAATQSPAAVATKSDKLAPPVPPVPLRREQVQRTMAIVVDDLTLSFESIGDVRRAVKKFVDEEMQPGDLVAIIRTGGGIGVLQQFTSDKRQLYAAIERIRWNLRGGGGVSGVPPITGDAIESAREGDEQFHEDINRKAREADAFRSQVSAIGTLGALNYVVRGLREMPGRKSVLLISDGIGINTPNLERFTDLANRASVVIYTMDARGLQTLGLTAADDIRGTGDDIAKLQQRRDRFYDTQGGLIYLSQQTGGFNIRNSNDLSGGIRRVMEDQSGYYLIGYRPEESTFNQKTGQRLFHKIGVKVKRSGLQVRSRTGFYGVTDEQVASVRRTREQQMAGALISPFNANAIDLRLTSLFGNDARMGSFMRSLLYIDARELTFTEEADGWHKTVIDVAAVTFGDNGQVIDQVNKVQTIRVRGATFQNVLKNGLVYFLNVPIKKPGAYQLRIAIRDSATEKVGSASQFIEVPDITKRLTLSGIAVNGYEPKAAQGAPPAQAGAQASAASNTEGAEDELDPQAGAAVRRFRRGMVMQFGYVIYNAQLDKATRRPQIQTQLRLFREGRLLFTGQTQPLDVTNQTDFTRLVAGSGLQLGSDMTPGEYVLQVIVTDLLAKPKERITTQWIDFEIIK